MKPVVIIAIAVGCSVVAVFGVLFGWQAYQEKVFVDEVTRIQNFDQDVKALALRTLPVVEECALDGGASGVYCMRNIKNDFQKSLYQISDQYGYSNEKQQLYEELIPFLDKAYYSAQADAKKYDSGYLVAQINQDFMNRNLGSHP